MNSAQAAQTLDEAHLHARAVGQLSAEGAFSLDEAHAIQRQLVARRAKKIQMNVDSLIWGWLTDAMVHGEGAPADLASYVHPRVEPAGSLTMAGAATAARPCSPIPTCNASCTVSAKWHSPPVRETDHAA